MTVKTVDSITEIVTGIRERASDLQGYPGHIVKNEVLGALPKEFKGHEVSGISDDYRHVTFRMPERSFNRDMYDRIRGLAEELNLGFTPKESGGGFTHDLYIHLKQGRATVVTLEEDRIRIDSANPDVEHYFESISSLYSEPQEEREREEVTSLGEILSRIKGLESYPKYVVKQEIYEGVREFRGHLIMNLGKFPDVNFGRTWTILLDMPETPFTKEIYDRVSVISEELGLKTELRPLGLVERVLGPKDVGEKRWLRQGVTTVAMLESDGLALNLEHPRADDYFNRFSEIYTT